MKKTKLTHKIKAVFMTLCFLPSLLPVNYLFASNNGPNAPEAAAFEPVDATDMVNLATGDLSYVMPLLNVPSPEGGYPLALSYHAGIALDQEASWVGLGWSLNPGALNRSVSGVPDDWKEGTKADVIYNIGGESKQKNFSISAGWGENTSIGIYISNSSNRAFGGEGSYTSSTDFGVSASAFGVGGRIGTDGVGISFDVVRAIATQATNADTGESTEVYLRGNKKNLFSVSADANFKTGSVSGSISKSGLGVTLGSNYGSVNFGPGSLSLYGANSLSSDMHLQINGFTLMIPFFNLFTINYSERKTRYWAYDRLTYDGIGSLYAQNATYRNNNDPLWFTNYFDAYESIYEHNKKNQLKDDNFSFASYDDYVVSGQGITGKIKPKLLETGTLKNKYQKIELDHEGEVRSRINFLTPVTNFQKSISDNTNPIHFYFENFYASYLRSSTDPWTQISNWPALNEIGEHVPSDTFQVVAPNGNSNYNSANKEGYVGNYIKTFTNNEINAGNAVGFIDTNSQGFDRSLFNNTKVNDGIGAFQITTIDGKTYHYSLPVYQKEKFTRSSQLDVNINQEFYEEQSLDHYATHWLLTAITGPDYVDDGDNFVNEDDLGYWVNFEYGKWSDGYSWRNPSGKFDFALNETTKSYSWGLKEVYYLNKINTRTHSAFFVKEAREDDFSTSMSVGNSRSDMLFYNQLIFGYMPGNVIAGKNGDAYLKGVYQNLAFGNIYSAINATAAVDDYYYIKTNKHRSLKLNKILLFENEDIPQDILTPNPTESSGVVMADMLIKEEVNWEFRDENQQYSLPTKIIKDEIYYGEFYNNVLDVGDVDLGQIENNSTKIIDFYHNYDLFNKVPNASSGRLTLQGVVTKGKSGENFIPPYKFDYYQIDYSRDIDAWGYEDYAIGGSLKEIKTPTGAKINITYDEDDYHEEIIPTRRVFDQKLQFDFTIINDRLQIIATDEQGSGGNITFTDYFQVGQTDIDLWACYRKDFFSGGCQTRSATIDIPKLPVDVIAVDVNSVTFETSASVATDNNGGLSELLGNTPVGLENTPNMIRVDNIRGECVNPAGCINVTPRLVFEYYLYGNVNLKNIDGGGLRVSEITTSDTNGEVFTTNYYYNKPNTPKEPLDQNYVSSGVTSYAPAFYNKEVKYLNELPAPYVVYEYVTVEKLGNGKFTGKELFKFKVLKDLIDNNSQFSIGDMLKITKSQNSTSQITMNNTGTVVDGNYNTYLLEDNLASIGSLLEKVSYNQYDQILSKVTNSYLSSLEKDQGIIEESYRTTKLLTNISKQSNGNYVYDYDVNFTTSSKISYSNVLKSTEISTGGLTDVTYSDVFDFNTGQVLETTTFNSKNIGLHTKIVPAYTEYSEMGTKVDNPANKNMLSQERAVYNYLDVGGQWVETDVSITSWKPWNNNIWRKHKSYVWKGSRNSNGTIQNFADDFNWSLINQDQTDNWLLTSEITKYNDYSMALESSDINRNLSSTKMDVKEVNILAVGNAGYEELYYSGAEDDDGQGNYGGGVLKGSAIDTNDSHTGDNALAISPGQYGYRVIVNHLEPTTKKYKVSVWAKFGNHVNTRLSINGGSPIGYNQYEMVRAGQWVQLNFYPDITTGAQVNIIAEGGSTIVDDFRLHPISTTMTSYVYNNWGELSNILGPNNLTTEYQYDAMGRLIRTLREVQDFNGPGTGGLKKSGQIDYTYKY